MSDGGYTGGQIFLAFLGGAAVGAAVGMLTAPDAGENIRNRVVTEARRRRDEVGRIPTAVRAAYSQAADAARAAFIEAYQAQADEGETSGNSSGGKSGGGKSRSASGSGGKAAANK